MKQLTIRHTIFYFYAYYSYALCALCMYTAFCDHQ